MVHLHTGVHMFVGFWMQHFQTGGLGEMVRHPGHHDRRISPPWLLFMGLCLGQSAFDTSSRYYKFEGKTNRRLCYNWTHVGEHVERNWLSIRRSPCNKRSTRWSVLMCCKKLLELHFEKKKKCLSSTYSSFLVINVCNQGNTLCSPCFKLNLRKTGRKDVGLESGPSMNSCVKPPIRLSTRIVEMLLNQQVTQSQRTETKPILSVT